VPEHAAREEAQLVVAQRAESIGAEDAVSNTFTSPTEISNVAQLAPVRVAMADTAASSAP
jgi:hypothetical protein